MSRRRFRVVCSSDEEEPPLPSPPLPRSPSYQGEQEDIIIDDIETDFQTVNINSSNRTPDTNNSTTNGGNTNVRFSSEPIHLDISDDEECDINNNSNNRSTYSSTNGNNQSDTSSSFRVSDSPVNGVLERLGLRLKREWLDSCLISLQSSVPGFQAMDDSSKAKLCFGKFLCSDMNYCGAGVLPSNVHTLNLVDLKGPFVLQVDEIVNISCPLRGRYQNAGPGIKRCLKLSMTDGVQRVFGMEYRPIKDLEVMSPAGLKIVLLNVNVRHGLLMLVPEVLEVLGGSVDELAVARQRLVNEINKPPRGKRTRTGVVPPLATRATLAAWPLHNTSVPGHADQSIRENTITLPGSGQENSSGIPAANRHRQAYADPGTGNNPESHTLSAPWAPERVNVVRPNDLPTRMPSQTAGKETEFITPPPNVRPMHDRVAPLSTNNGACNSSFPVQPQVYCATPRNVDRTAGTPLMDAGQGTSFRVPVDAVFREDDVVSEFTNVSDHNTSSTGRQEEFRGHIYGHMMEGTKPIESTGHGGHLDYTHGEDVTVPDNAKPNPSSSVYMDVEEISVADNVMHPFIFSGENEIPFTYLASLSAKWTSIEDNNNASVVRGKIKCFLTGVKGFQYKKRTTYELRVYVDDGSLISEVLVDHDVVQSGIGFSPREVSSALASSDARQVKDMKETMKQFQIFLVNFEGTMVVEMSKTSPVPVALEMTQGCSASDASLLLKRIKSSNSTPLKDCHLNLVDIRP
ncbi:recQ-mediated genome instability protein 1 [Primulina tabacum]|uniref:recQ-mediated genome instability protein 1 n=1 Tax=Primulina tabacum TaxID=48773 RepID=UPI003F5AB394